MSLFDNNKEIIQKNIKCCGLDNYEHNIDKIHNILEYLDFFVKSEDNLFSLNSDLIAHQNTT